MLKKIWRYSFVDTRCNRRLSGQEKGDHFSQHKEQGQPWYQMAVIRMNSTYLECVDRMFEERGMNSALGVIFQIPLVWGWIASLLLIIDKWPSLEYDKKMDYAFFIVGTGVMFFLVCLMFTWFIKLEWFQYTHYPLRFNRKTRKVYVFRRDGTAWSESWDKFYFTIITQTFGRRRIGMLLLDREWTDEATVMIKNGKIHYADPKTIARVDKINVAMEQAVVREQVFLPFVTDESDHQQMYSLFEFIRRYMDGDEAQVAELAKQIDYAPDIVDKRETFWGGAHYMDVMFTGRYLHARIINYLTTLPLYIVGRWVAMNTSKIPIWPEEIEQECQFEPDDPNLRDAQHLSPPDAAQIPFTR